MITTKEDSFYYWRVKHRLNNLKNKSPFKLNKWHIISAIIGIGIICNIPIHDNNMIGSVKGEIVSEIYTRPGEEDLIVPVNSKLRPKKQKKEINKPIEQKVLPSPYTEVDKILKEVVELDKALPEKKVFLATPYKIFAPEKKKNNTQIALDFFETKGYSKHHSAAIVGNLLCESSLNIKAIGDGGKAYGIAQWHPNRQKMFKKVIGKDIRHSNLKDQLEFVHWELHNTESKAGGIFKTAKNVWEAASLFDRHYERSSGKARKTRISLSKKIFSSLN